MQIYDKLEWLPLINSALFGLVMQGPFCCLHVFFSEGFVD